MCVPVSVGVQINVLPIKWTELNILVMSEIPLTHTHTHIQTQKHSYSASEKVSNL